LEFRNIPLTIKDLTGNDIIFGVKATA